MSTHLKTPVAIPATESNREAINQDRRKLLVSAAMGLAAAGAASLFPIRAAPAATNDAIRPFHINVPEEDLQELERIEERFTPLVRRCKELGRALRIGTNHGSLSDRIMNRYGDTPAGHGRVRARVPRICEDEGYRDVVFSMKA